LGILFSLTLNAKFTDTNTGCSIYHHNSYGPRFGDGNDIYISNNSNTNNSYANIGSTYKNSNFPSGTAQTWKSFSGGNDYNFKTV
jgi:hypothetical protein